MKNLLLASALCCLSFFANAQRLELGANFGFNHSYTPAEKNTLPVASLKAAYNVCSGFQVGISSNFTWISYEAVSKPLIFEDQFNRPQPPIATPVYFSQTQFVNSTKVFANVKKELGKVAVYIGGSGGFITTFAEQATFVGYGPKNGYTAGGQLGATYFVTENFGINAEVGADYINLGGTRDYNRDALETNVKTWNFPATIGIRYRLL